MKYRPTGLPVSAWLLSLLFVATTALAGQDVDRTFTAKAYPGSKNREYIVHLPTGYDASRPRPLVMVLHGCKQTHRTIKNESGFDALADAEGFIVVYPFITRYDGLRNENCWGFWFDQEIHAGAGEVQDLAGIIDEVAAAYAVDPNRIHITGLSSGGAMAVAVMVAHSERIASGAETAGLAYGETAASVPRSCTFAGVLKSPAESAAAMDGEMGAGKRLVPLFIVHSENDCTVNIQAARNLRDSWGIAFGVDTANPMMTRSGTTQGTPWTRSSYGSAGVVVLETLFLKGLNHGWYGNGDGEYAFSNAPDSARLMWDFFQAHPLHGNTPPTVTIAAAFVEGEDCITVTGSAADSDGTVDTVTVTLEGANAPPAAATLTADSYHYTACNLPRDAWYTPRVRAVDDAGAATEVLGEPLAVGQPPVNPPPTLTLAEPSVEGDCVTLAGTATDDSAVTAVEARIGDGAWSEAALAGEGWSYRACGLAAGSYATAARATDDGGAVTTETGASAVVSVRHEGIARADLTGHLLAQRLRLYANGFGAADRSYLELYYQHGVRGVFPLYLAQGRWYADPANIPSP